MPSTYEQLKAKIIKAVPEIMDLKKGCEFKFANQSMIIFGRKDNYNYLTYRADFNLSLVPFIISIDQLKYDKTVKIIGRPIRLTDVMITLEKKSRNNTDTYAAFTNGYIETINTKDLLGYYNLSDDNLEHQAKEFQEKLLEILS